jgi:hypothetical protein
LARSSVELISGRTLMGLLIYWFSFNGEAQAKIWQRLRLAVKRLNANITKKAPSPSDC